MNADAKALAASFDLEKLTTEFYDNPYPTYRALRENEPVKRLPEPEFAKPLVVTGSEFRFIVTEQLAGIGKAPGAVLIEPGSSLIYFTGVRWSRIERLTATVLPVEGKPLVVTPFFEEPSVR